MNRALLLITLLICCCSSGLAQQLISASGGTTTHSGISMSWSLGEAIVGTTSSVFSQTSIGFQQNYNFIVIGVEEADRMNLSLFPNPARDFITLELQRIYEIEIQLTVYNLSGSIVIQKAIPAQSKTVELDLSGISSGPYQIILVGPKSKLANVGFVKL